MFFDNTKMDVKMNGKEYLEWQKYKQVNKFKLPKKLSNRTIGIIIICCVIIFATFTIALIHDYYNPPQTIEWGYSNFWGVSIHNGLVLWLAICIGIGWMGHGVGFFIIRR